MPTTFEKKLSALEELLEKLRKKALKGIPIIVEGKNDVEALRILGIEGNITCVKSSGKVFVDLLDEVIGDEVIVLVDFDRNGIRLTKQIIQYLEAKGIKVDSFLWKEIGALIRRDVKDIEGLPSYLEKLKKHVGAH